jgi:hypothetical protein
MLEELKIKIWGTQPVAKVTDKQLDRLVEREFSQYIDAVKNKLYKVESDTLNGKNRISAAIIKLSNKDLKLLDHYIDIANADCKDVLSQAEYPRCSKLGFDDFDNNEMKSIYLDDWREYSKWLND